ncbi:MAG: glucose-1-phosphate cytidylyltransferase [Chloroflexi bacterium]|nr:glucose-1-phosphate cytidylyltransferase [Chloroflexota bacterium]
MKVLILCGGRGIIDTESRIRIPKGMVNIGERPTLWHIMKTFSTYGHNEFVLALGEGGQFIRDYFIDYRRTSQNVEISLSTGSFETLNPIPGEDWRIKLIDTGRNALTGSRIARCRRYLEDGSFIISYSDCLCDVSITNLLAFHRSKEKIITITGVQPPSRFGTFFSENSQVTGYTSQGKLVGKGGYINGGYMVAEPSLFDFLSPYNESSLEEEVFSQLAKDGQVAIFPHAGYWQAIDTERDIFMLNDLYKNNQRPWLPTPLSLR